MVGKKKSVSANGIIIFLLVLLSVVVVREGYATNEKWYWVLIVILPLLLVSILNLRQKGDQ